MDWARNSIFFKDLKVTLLFLKLFHLSSSIPPSYASRGFNLKLKSYVGNHSHHPIQHYAHIILFPVMQSSSHWYFDPLSINQYMQNETNRQMVVISILYMYVGLICQKNTQIHLSTFSCGNQPFTLLHTMVLISVNNKARLKAVQ